MLSLGVVLTAAPPPAGTFCYAAPELLMGDRCTEAIDLFRWASPPCIASATVSTYLVSEWSNSAGCQWQKRFESAVTHTLYDAVVEHSSVEYCIPAPSTSLYKTAEVNVNWRHGARRLLDRSGALLDG